MIWGALGELRGRVRFGSGGFRVTIKGDPCIQTDVAFSEDGGNACVQACLGTAARTVISIPLVRTAPTGVTHSMDLAPRIVGKG